MKKVLVTVFLVLFFIAPVQADAGDAATAKDVYDLVIKAYDVVKNLGDAALPAFNDPKGEFVYKDTYVYVMKCPLEMAAHPFAMEKLKGVDLSKFPHTAPTCKAAKNPNGEWVEVFWPKPGEKEPSRKVTFGISVEGTPYQLFAGIYSDAAKIEDLNKNLR